MNKNLKVVSSLALAGILATTGLAGLSKVSAAEVDPSTRSLGKYATLGGVENVVPYILNVGDNVTIKDLKNEFNITAFNGNTVASEDTIVGTGDTFKSGSTTYTVIVYGDTNGDGLVDSDDAFDMLSHYVGNKTLSGVYLEAANVEDTIQNVVDSDDAYRTKGFYVGNVTTSRDRKPTNVQPVEGGYTLTVGANNVVNNQNFDNSVDADNLKLVVDVDNSKISNEAKTLELNVYDANGAEVVKGVSIGSLAANSNKAEITGKDLSSDLGIATDGTKNGTYTLELVDATKTKKVILARTNINVKILTPAAAKINVTRQSATTAALSLEGYGEGKIVKVEYTIDGVTKSFENVSNKLANKALDYVLPDGNKTMSLVLTDEFGNKATIPNVGIPKYGATTEEAVVKVKAPVLKEVTVAEFTILDKDENAKSVTGEAVLYDGNGKIVAVKPISKANKVDFTSNMAKAGKYKVGITVTGDAIDTTNSAEVVSDVVEVKELNVVTAVEFNVTKDGDKVITFADSNKKENVDATTPYTVTFEKLDSNNEYQADNTVTATVDVEKHTATITGLAANTIYRATIVVNKNANQLEYVENTKPATSTPFFYIDATTLLGALDSRTDKSLTYVLANPIAVNGTDATYKAEVNKVLKDANNQDYTLENNKETKNAVVTVDKDDATKKYLTIEGLAQDQRYVVKIIATVGNVTGESGLVGYVTGSYATAPSTYATAPAINGLKVVKGDLDVEADKAKAVANTLFVNVDGKVVINGDIENPITIGSNNYAPEFNDILTFASTLVENDKITVNDTKITLALTEDKSASGDTVTIPATKFEGKEVEVIGNGIASDRTVEVESGAKLSKLSVGGNGLILALTNNDADTEVYLNNGAEVTGENTYTLVKGSTATINGITAKTTNTNMSITADDNKELTVNAPKGDINTDLTFTNNNNGRYDVTKPATIHFASNDQTSRISGTVKINSEAGEVKVTSPNDGSLDVTKLNLAIDVKDANVDITGFTDGAKVNVTIATTEKEDPADDNTLTAKLGKSKLDMLDKLTTKVANNDSVVLQKYAVDEKITLSSGKELSEADTKLMQEFIDSFGINNENVTMTFTNITKGEVTITVKGDTKVDLSGFATYGD